VTHSPALCSQAVEHAMGSSVPHTNYMLGPHGGWLRVLRLLPDWFVDRQVRSCLFYFIFFYFIFVLFFVVLCVVLLFFVSLCC